MNSLAEYINQYFGISSSNLNEVASLFKRKQVKKGDFLLKSGRFCTELSFIQTGIIRVFAQNGNKEITQWIGTEGFFLTDLASFAFKEPSRWNFQALVDTELYVLDKKKYPELIEIEPNWPELEKQLISKCFVTVENRVFQFLSLSAEQRYKQLFDSNKELFNQVPLQYLASMLGMSPETLSRIRAKSIS